MSGVESPWLGGVDLPAWARALGQGDVEGVGAVMARAFDDLTTLQGDLVRAVHRFTDAPDPVIAERLRASVEALDEATERIYAVRTAAYDQPRDAAPGGWGR